MAMGELQIAIVKLVVDEPGSGYTREIRKRKRQKVRVGLKQARTMWAQNQI